MNNDLISVSQVFNLIVNALIPFLQILREHMELGSESKWNSFILFPFLPPNFDWLDRSSKIYTDHGFFAPLPFLDKSHVQIGYLKFKYFIQ